MKVEKSCDLDLLLSWHLWIVFQKKLPQNKKEKREKKKAKEWHQR